MPKVIGVRFRTSPRMYYFAPTEGEEYEKGTNVVVETQRGVELATVILPVTEVSDDNIVAPLKGVMRIATQSDLDAAHADDDQKQSILATAKQKVAERKLDMKIVDCEFTVDHGKLVLYFTAEQRVDFRELVRDLASAFHMRIDLRQIGARDECKLIGSLGACGLPCCCGRFESDSEHVSIKMAKCQNLALTPNKINGMCGRLLCCLSYENKTYEEVAKKSPKPGTFVTCPDGRRGSVVSVTPLTEKVRVRVGDDENFEFAEFTLDEISFDKKRAPAEPDSRRDAKDSPVRQTENGAEQNKFNSDRPQKNKYGNKNGSGDRRPDNVGGRSDSRPERKDPTNENGSKRQNRNKRFNKYGNKNGRPQQSNIRNDEPKN